MSKSSEFVCREIKSTNNADGTTTTSYEITDALVRCKDCALHEDVQPGMVYCSHVIGGWISEDWYCASGLEEVNDESN